MALKHPFVFVFLLFHFCLLFVYTNVLVTLQIDDDEVVSECETKTTHLSELDDEYSFVQWVFKKAFMEIGAVVSFVVAMAVIMYSNYDIVQQQE